MQSTAFSRDGYLIDQTCAADEPYGRCATSTNGCGWVAAYNILHACGRSTAWQQVRDALCKGLCFGGHLGTGPLRLVRWLRAQQLCVQCTFSRTAAARRANSCRAGAVLYFTGTGLHYAAFAPTQTRGALRFFNAVPGAQSHVQTLLAFCRAHTKLPVVLFITLPSAKKGEIAHA